MKLFNRKNKFSVSMLIMFVVLVIYSLVLLGLCYWSVESSLKSNREFSKNPVGWPDNIENRYDGVLNLFSTNVYLDDGSQRTWNFWGMVLNSISYSVGCALAMTVVTYIVAYFTARYKYGFSKIIHGLVVVYMVTPVVGTLPSYIAVSRSLNLFGKMYGMWIMNATFLGLYFLVFYEIFKSMPKSYFEAARIDGANDVQLLTKIALPMSLNAFFTVFLINFIKFWNDYQSPLIYVRTRPVVAYGMFLLIEQRPYVPQLMAAAVVVLVPIILLFVLTNKKLMSNVTIGGIKG